jgi:hypothetical protein
MDLILKRVAQAAPVPVRDSCIGLILDKPHLDDLREDDFESYFKEIRNITTSERTVTCAWRKAADSSTVVFAVGLQFERICAFFRRGILLLAKCQAADEALEAASFFVQSAKESEACGFEKDVLLEFGEIDPAELKKASHFAVFVAHCLTIEKILEVKIRAGLYRAVSEKCFGAASPVPLGDEDNTTFDVALRYLGKFCELEAHSLSATQYFDEGHIEKAAGCAKRAVDLARKAHVDYGFFDADYVHRMDSSYKKFAFVLEKAGTPKKNGRQAVVSVECLPAIALPDIQLN